MKKYLFYWRLFVLAIMILLLLTIVISPDTFLAMMIGIIVFVGMPESVKAIKNKRQKENL